MALCPGLPGWASTRKVKPILILLKQETVGGSGISQATCKSAPKPQTDVRITIHFTGQMPFLPPNLQCQGTEGKFSDIFSQPIIFVWIYSFSFRSAFFHNAITTGLCYKKVSELEVSRCWEGWDMGRGVPSPMRRVWESQKFVIFCLKMACSGAFWCNVVLAYSGCHGKKAIKRM